MSGIYKMKTSFTLILCVLYLTLFASNASAQSWEKIIPDEPYSIDRFFVLPGDTVITSNFSNVMRYDPVASKWGDLVAGNLASIYNNIYVRLGTTDKEIWGVYHSGYNGDYSEKIWSVAGNQIGNLMGAKDSIICASKAASFDGGRTWEYYNTSHTLQFMLIDAQTIYFVAYEYTGIYFYKFFADYGLKIFCSDYARKANNDSVRISEIKGIYKRHGKLAASTDIGIIEFNGKNWNIIGDPSFAPDYICGNYAVKRDSIFDIHNVSSPQFIKKFILPYPSYFQVAGTKIWAKTSPHNIECFDTVSSELKSITMGFPSKLIDKMGSDKNGTLYAKTSLSEIFSSSDGGATWCCISYGKFANIDDMMVTDNLIMASIQFYPLCSKDGGETWSRLDLDNGFYFQFRNGFSNKKNAIAEGSEYLISGHIYYLTNDVDPHWVKLFAITNGSPVYALYTDDNYRLVSYSENNLVAIGKDSSDIVLTHTPVSLGTGQAEQITSFVSDKAGNYYGGSSNGMLKLGASSGVSANSEWQYSGLQGKKISALCADSNNIIYASTNDGIYYSMDKGATWIAFSEAPEDPAYGIGLAKCLLVYNNELFATTGAGLFKAPTKTIGIKNSIDMFPKKFSLEQNYPNPFNPATVISFSVPKASHIKLMLYNILGEHIKTLIDEEMAAGKHQYIFNGESLSTGIYVYVLKGENFFLSRKMLLLK